MFITHVKNTDVLHTRKMYSCCTIRVSNTSDLLLLSTVKYLRSDAIFSVPSKGLIIPGMSSPKDR